MTGSTPLRRAVAAVAIIAFVPVGTAWPQGKLKRLGAKEIRAQIVGNVLTDGIHWSRHFQRNGTLASVDMGRKNIGRWKIEGDRLCLAIEVGEDFNCYEVLASGREVHLHVEDTGLDLEATIKKP